MLSFVFIITPILLFLITIYLKINIKDNYLFWLFFTIYCFLFYLIPVINYGSSGFSQVLFDSSAKVYIYNLEAVMKLYIFQTSYYILFLFGYKITPRQINPKNSVNKNTLFTKKNINKTIIISSTLSLIGTIGTVYFSGMSLQQLITTSRFDYWETKSTVPHLISSYLQTLLAVSAFLIPYSKNKISKVITIISLFTFFYIEMMIFGSRSTFLAVGAAFALGLINYLKSENKKIKIGKILPFALLLSHLMIVWQYVRYNSSTFQTIGDWLKGIFNFKEAYYISLSGGDLNYFFGASLASLDAVPSNHDYLYGSTYFRLILFFLPSSVVPFKPEETQRIFASIINPEKYIIGATFPPSFIGDSYINFGFFGIIVGLGLGILLKAWQVSLNGPLTINKIAIGSAGFLFLLLFIRGTFNGMYNLIFIWIFLFGISILLKSIDTKSQKANKVSINKTPI